MDHCSPSIWASPNFTPWKHHHQRRHQDHPQGSYRLINPTGAARRAFRQDQQQWIRVHSDDGNKSGSSSIGGVYEAKARSDQWGPFRRFTVLHPPFPFLFVPFSLTLIFDLVPRGSSQHDLSYAWVAHVVCCYESIYNVIIRLADICKAWNSCNGCCCFCY